MLPRHKPFDLWYSWKQVSTQGSAGVEERAWMLLNNQEELPANTDIISVLSSGCKEMRRPLALNGALEDPKHSVQAFEALQREKKHADLFQRECGSQPEHFENIGLSLTPRSHIDPVQNTKCEDGHGRKCDRTLFRSSLDDAGAHGRIGWSGSDPVLSALLRRFGEIEAEIQRRHSTTRS